MHGTFRGRIEEGAGITVRFDARVLNIAPPARRWRAKVAALLAGCCVAAMPIASLPTAWRSAEPQPPVRPGRMPHPAVRAAADYPMVAVAMPAVTVPAVSRPATAERGEHGASPQPPTLSLPTPSPPSPEPGPQAPAAAAIPVQLASAPAPSDIRAFTVPPLPAGPIAVALPTGPATVALPELAPQLAVIAPPAARPPVATAATPAVKAPLRPVDVEQLADSEVRSLRVPQLHAPGLVAGGDTSLSGRIAAMQVTPLPPPRLRDSDRAVLLAEAPTRLTLRIGDSAVGKVDFRMTATRTIDVKLASLLDVLAGQYDAAEFARLRSSSAADAYVSFDQLRALGLNVRYDPAYDELRING
jgi:hypothetical protein